MASKQHKQSVLNLTFQSYIFDKWDFNIKLLTLPDVKFDAIGTFYLFEILYKNITI